MGEPENYRMGRIERLLKELEYEVTRGMLEREIDEHLGFRFIIPISSKIKNGIVACEFRTRPLPHGHMWPDDLQPRLKVVAND